VLKQVSWKGRTYGAEGQGRWGLGAVGGAKS
jgi:hypothetical protein